MMNFYQRQAKTKSFNNTYMPANLMKRRVDNHLFNTFFLQGIIHNNTFNALYILKYVCI